MLNVWTKVNDKYWPELRSLKKLKGQKMTSLTSTVKNNILKVEYLKKNKKANPNPKKSEKKRAIPS